MTFVSKLFRPVIFFATEPVFLFFENHQILAKTLTKKLIRFSRLPL